MIQKKHFIKCLVCISCIFMIQIAQADVIRTYTQADNSSYAVINFDTSVTPAGLQASLSNFKQTLAPNITILGISTILPLTIELAYQLKDQASYFIACQELKARNGWNYEQFINSLTTSPYSCDPKTFAFKLVKSYGDYYIKTTETFALSAIDLSKITDLVNNINSFIQAVKECENFDSKNIKNIVTQAAQRAISFNVADYIDLNSFYRILLIQINKIKTDNVEYNNAIQSLQTIINAGKTLLYEVVFFGVCGERASGAGGLSIYYPKSTNQTPLNTNFENATHWRDFITQYR